MNLYEQIKTHITPKHVTERYGPPIHRGDMICCPFHDDRIHVKNGTLFFDGHFTTDKDYCRNRLPVSYNPNAPKPEKWL